MKLEANSTQDLEYYSEYASMKCCFQHTLFHHDLEL